MACSNKTQDGFMQSLVYCTMGKRSFPCPHTPAKYQTFKSASTEGNDSGMFSDIVEACSFRADLWEQSGNW